MIAPNAFCLLLAWFFLILMWLAHDRERRLPRTGMRKLGRKG